MRFLLVLLLLIFPIFTHSCSGTTTYQFLLAIFTIGSVFTISLATIGVIILLVLARIVPKYRVRGTGWLLKKIVFIYGIGVGIFIFSISIFVGFALYSSHTPGMSLLETLNYNPCDEWMRESTRTYFSEHTPQSKQ